MQKSRPELYDPVDYKASQALATELRDQNSLGIIFDSVRHPGGSCVAVLRPRVISNCSDGDVVTYNWNGTKIDGFYWKGKFELL